LDLRSVVLASYFAVLTLLVIYGIHRWFLLALYVRHRRFAARAFPPIVEAKHLTVQIPLYNELHVARRAIEAVAALDWPAGRLEIQVLDDSDDETAAAVAATVEEFRERGLDVVHVRRTTRAGYKAGALAHGLTTAKGELIAVFDADFVPAPDFAKALAGHFAEPRVGMVQARWGHLNRDASLLTRTQGILLDGHFVIEHAARHRSGRFFNFNGTAGIWRKSCIEDAGGWQHDTLTEDLDLSYRAQLRGWNFVYVQDAVAPAELPVEMGAFKSQQHRWAQGSAQTARKLLPSILASRLPVRVKLESLFHLTSNAGYVLMLALAILMGPAVWFRRGAPWAQLAAVDLPLIALSLGSIGVFYAISQRAAYGSRAAVWRYIPVLLGVGIGISINGTRAVLAGLRGGDTEFRRTPKYALSAGGSAALATRRYRASRSYDTWIELGFGIYFLGIALIAVGTGLWAAVPFLALFAFGFLYTAIVALRQARVPLAVSRSTS
jgi:cellulose synthase/poly-beta-1,6-N-acetylglucosamine synthase-like glycosyltransferase